MNRILLLGAGRSATVLIHYLLEHALEWNASVTVGDQSVSSASAKVGSHTAGRAIAFDATDETMRRTEIEAHDIIISMLPPHLHILVAKDCLAFKKHLVTASYVTPELQQLNEDVKRAGLLFMCEMGLDPGIDHMSAMKMIHAIQEKGGRITSFKSGTGGLVAPESDDNPWHYKVTWNPRNVVLAGQSTAQYLENGVQKFVPYHRMFTTTEAFKISGYGKFESYPNRDSMAYISKYGLEGVQTILRSTLRKEGYCDAWNALVQLGLTDDSYTLNNSQAMSYADWVNCYLPEKEKWTGKSAKSKTAKFLGLKNSVLNRLEWLGIFSDEKIPLDHGTPAQILQNLLERKWMMQPSDNDMIVMRHEVRYEMEGKKKQQLSTMILKGDDVLNTAMAKTVGLPLGIMVRLLLQSEIFLTGVHIPVMSQVYLPVLQELDLLGVGFVEEERGESSE
ncbi:MAG: saccharopine dehydrogenase NADP-binding domain-containing protein [Chitinophagaceae bacterium]|nr:saccharopine dehydrogenase NADP-binding domain-containing protein [Chitinophagaceae bacterium]